MSNVPNSKLYENQIAKVFADLSIDAYKAYSYVAPAETVAAEPPVVEFRLGGTARPVKQPRTYSA